MNFNRRLILASSSPRRQFLLREAGFEFTIKTPDIDESFPDGMDPKVIPSWLAEKKANVVEPHDAIVIASDTIVVLDGAIMNKPAGRAEAIAMLSQLSGKTHQVITAVCLRSRNKTSIFDDTTEVTFRKLTTSQIEFYIDHFNPLDKAGSYGAQDCLPPGLNPCSPKEWAFLQKINKTNLLEKSIGVSSDNEKIVIIDHLKGAYFTVMGLPLHKVYDRLLNF